MSTGGVDLGQQDLQQRQSLRIQDLGFRVQGLGFCKFRVDFGFRFVLFFVFFCTVSCLPVTAGVLQVWGLGFCQLYTIMVYGDYFKANVYTNWVHGPIY